MTKYTVFDNWFGSGKDHGIALMFVIVALIDLAATLLDMASKSYKVLTKAYAS